MSSNNHSLTLLLFFLLFNLSFCDPCLYKATRAQTFVNSTDEGTYISQTSSESSKKQKCFSLSNSDVFSSKCCYDTSAKKCVKEGTTSSTTVECPKDTIIDNNCGMAGFYQPVTSERCTEISLVDGYCCYVKTKNNDTACVRRKELEDDTKNEITDDIKEYVKNRGGNPDDIKEVFCEGFLLKINLFFALFFLFANYII